MKSKDRNKRPSAASPEFEGVPAELRDLKNWVLWRFEWREDKAGEGSWTKVPYQVTGGRASSTGQETWVSFPGVMTAYERAKSSYDGIGFVFTGTPYAGIDLDECVKEEDDQYRLTPFAQRVVDRLNTYTEFSVSKTGLHCIGLAGEFKALKTELNGNEIEVYCTGRYFTFTGISWQAEILSIRDVQFDLTDIVEKIRAKKERKLPEAIFSVDDRLQLALRNPKLAELFQGDIWEYGGDDSRADFALCRYLAHYADGSADLLDSMFRKSKLYRPKWDDRRGDSTYGQQTIGKVLAGQRSSLGARPSSLPREFSYETRKVRRFGFDDLWEAAMQYRSGKISQGVHPGCPAISRVYRPRKGLMSVIIGDPGSGKTTMVDTWAYYIAKHYGWPFTFASFETQPLERHILDLCQIHLGKPTFTFIKDEAGNSLAATDQEMEQARVEIGQYFKFLKPDDDELSLDAIMAFVDDDIRDFGIGGFVLDPWSEIDQKRNLYQSQTEFVEQELRKLRAFTRQRDIHTWLIVHPTKAGENRKDGRPTLYSATGSSHFYNKADYGVVVHVHGNKQTSVYVDKVRFSELGERDAEVQFIYDTHARRYLPLEG